MTRNTSKITTICCSAALLAGAGAWATGLLDHPAAAAPRPGMTPIGPEIAGTWLTDPMPRPVWATAGSQKLTNFNADGTLIETSNLEYGARGTRMLGTIQGAWVQTGPLEISSRELLFLYSVTGAHTHTIRGTSVFTFSPDVQSYTAEVFDELFTVDQDPLDPASVPIASGAGAFTGRRLNPPM